MTEQNDSPIRFLRLSQVMERTGFKRTAIYKYISQGDFPKQVALTGRGVAWVESEIIAWQQQRMMARG